MNTEKEWRRINDAWLKSGLSQKQFCEQNNISYSKFTILRSRLMQAGLSTSLRPKLSRRKESENLNAFTVGKTSIDKNQFIPLQINPLMPSLKHSPQPMIELHLPHGITLRIPIDEKRTAE